MGQVQYNVAVCAFQGAISNSGGVGPTSPTTPIRCTMPDGTIGITKVISVYLSDQPLAYPENVSFDPIQAAQYFGFSFAVTMFLWLTAVGLGSIIKAVKKW